MFRTQERHHLVRYVYHTNTIKFPAKIASFVIADFSAAIFEWQKRKRYEQVTLDFSVVTHPYSNGMLAIIATVTDLRQRGFMFRIILPESAQNRRLFREKNWAHHLNPEVEKRSESIMHRHMVVRPFHDFREVATVVNDIMELVLRSMSNIPKDIFAALEWSVNEVCDNVINHSNSKIGGFAEVVTFTKNDMISFSVADAGRGILNSLREGIPGLSSDIQAIGEAVRAGVTRSKEGQGNGLAGAMRVTSMSGGSLDITSGTGRFYITGDKPQKVEGDKRQGYKGTVVSGVIKINRSFSAEKALMFGGVPYKPVDLIELNYEMKEEDSLLIQMKEETSGFGTRHSGRQLRTKTINLIQTRPGFPLYIDWEGIPIISSSFADEFIGKLFLELGPLNFSSYIRNKNVEPLIKGLLDKAISQRLTQANDE